MNLSVELDGLMRDFFGVELLRVGGDSAPGTKPAKPDDWLSTELREKVIAPFLCKAAAVLYDVLPRDEKHLAMYISLVSTSTDHMSGSQIRTAMCELGCWLNRRSQGQLLKHANDREWLEKIEPLRGSFGSVDEAVEVAFRKSMGI